ncbi:cytochrome c551 [Bacillus marasmi]|uniref:cytochrome c551 n=1 Tax=Bacillus marasmi TaxID=1926279 RepID=UPI0011C81081|nr:c-type cytochrome [Bacillus marasmi]
MKKKLFGLLIGTSILLAACGGGGEETKDTAGGAADPEKLFSQKCSSCHGADLKGGGGGAFPDLTAVGSRLSKEEIETVILEGKGSMPKGQLTGGDATAVAEWLAEKK